MTDWLNPGEQALGVCRDPFCVHLPNPYLGTCMSLPSTFIYRTVSRRKCCVRGLVGEPRGVRLMTVENLGKYAY